MSIKAQEFTKDQYINWVNNNASLIDIISVIELEGNIVATYREESFSLENKFK